MHVLELRSGPQGHPAYRKIVQEMHRLIAEQAGHRAIAAAMRFVDHSETDLGRLEAEQRSESKRQSYRAGPVTGEFSFPLDEHSPVGHN